MPEPAAAAPMDGDTCTVGALALGVLRTHADKFLAQVPGARQGEDPEAVHQMRVATRRLRAALKVFSTVLPADADGLRQELAWIAGELGAVRDLDVQIEHTLALADESSARPAIEPFVAWLGAQRERCREALLQAFDDVRFGQLTERLQTSLAVWHTGASQDADVRQWAPPRIKRVFKKLRRAADDLGSDVPAEALHQVRIRAKRVRYTVEFFVSVYGAPAEAVVKRTVALQDLLGAVQDGVVARQQMDEALRTAGQTWPVETAFVLGQLAERQATRPAALRAEFPRTYAKLRRKAWRPLKAQL